MTGVDWGRALDQRRPIYLQMQLCLVTLGTFSRKLLETYLFNSGHTAAFSPRSLRRWEYLKAPFLSRFQSKRHQAASPPARASSGGSESRARESFHVQEVRTQLQLGKLVSGVYGPASHAPSSLLLMRPRPDAPCPREGLREAWPLALPRLFQSAHLSELTLTPAGLAPSRCYGMAGGETFPIWLLPGRRYGSHSLGRRGKLLCI